MNLYSSLLQYGCISKLFAHLPLDEVAVFWTIDFLVFQEDTVTMTSTHEVVVTGA